MSTTLPATLKPPIVMPDGRHWEKHGATVYHRPQATYLEDERATAAGVDVYSYGHEHRGGDVLLSIGRQPFAMSLYLEPDDADRIADALRLAAQQARLVRAIKARRAARAVEGDAA
ncbi:MAG: hypothetical protein JSR74_12530 [Proteobacteria bacterium]|nr:hypothetical protein [Pseudomonadota bacterium]